MQKQNRIVNGKIRTNTETMSGTLQRLGSIRRSLRHPKKLLLAPENKQGNDVCTSNSMPEKVEEVGLKGKSSKQTYFRLSVADASISVNASYRYDKPYSTKTLLSTTLYLL